MAGPPATQSPPGQGAPPGYQYPQQGYPQQQPQGFGGSAPPAAWNPNPMPAASRPMNWEMISFGVRAIGFILIALGALIVVATVSVPGSCFSTGQTCTTNPATYFQGAANGLMWGKMIVVIGALLLGLGAGIKLHWVLRAPVNAQRGEEWAWVIVERFFNYGIVVVSIFLIVGVLNGFALANLANA